MTPFAIGLGSNLGDSLAIVRGAVRALDQAGQRGGSRVRAMSRVYRSPPVGGVEQPAFLNAVAILEWGDAPESLLATLHSVERSHGRDRASESIRWGPRVLDLDILLAGEDGSISCVAQHLTIPHPRAFDRAFVLKPLADVAPTWRHPATGERVDLALSRVADDARLVVPIAEGLAAPCRGTMVCAGDSARDVDGRDGRDGPSAGGGSPGA